MDHVNNLLGKHLHTLRGERSLYQVEKLSGIPRSLMSRYERGVLIPETNMLRKIANFYGVNIQELKELGFEDLYPDSSEDREFLLAWVKKIL